MLVFILGLFFSVSFAFSQNRNTRFVAVEVAEVKSSSGFFAQNVGTLQLGDEVAVLRDSGRWSEVRSGSVAGWVVSASLSPRRVLRSSSSVNPGEVALAGKGFTQELENENRSDGLSYSRVDQMESLVIPREELRGFIVDGRLSGAN
jgi:hypothetical protein